MAIRHLGEKQVRLGEGVKGAQADQGEESWGTYVDNKQLGNQILSFDLWSVGLLSTI